MFSHDDFRRAVGTLVNAEFIGINCGSLLISTPDSGFLIHGYQLWAWYLATLQLGPREYILPLVPLCSNLPSRSVLQNH